MIRLERTDDGGPVQRNFERLMSLVLDTGGVTLSIRVGADVVTYAGGSSSSGDATIDHGLGTTPVAVFTQSQGITTVTRPATVGATTFQVRGITVDGSTPGAGTEVDFFWLAIG